MNKHDGDNKAEQLIADIRNAVSPLCTLVGIIQHEKLKLDDPKLDKIFQEVLKQSETRIDYIREYDKIGKVSLRD